MDVDSTFDYEEIENNKSTNPSNKKNNLINSQNKKNYAEYKTSKKDFRKLDSCIVNQKNYKEPCWKENILFRE